MYSDAVAYVFMKLRRQGMKTIRTLFRPIKLCLTSSSLNAFDSKLCKVQIQQKLYEKALSNVCSIFVNKFPAIIMRKTLLFFCFLLAINTITAQTNQLWKGYFSYNEIKDISQSNTRFFAASENALFSKHLQTNVLKTTNTVDGLSGQTITAIHHSPSLNKTLIGYDNGLIIIVNEQDGTTLNVVDIINKQLPPQLKKVNHFSEYNGIIYISCDFGIVQYNLATLGFGDTYFIGIGIPEIVIEQTAVFNNYIYAATATQGIKRADVNNPNLIDATQWSTVSSGNFIGITSFGTELVALSSSGQLSRYNGNTFSFLASVASANDIRSAADNLIVTSPSRVYLYNQNLANTLQINSSQIIDFTPYFTCATVIGNTIYMGTNADGVFTTSLSNSSTFENIKPDGPLRNNIFSINTASANTWVTYGDYTGNYDPYPLSKYGLSRYTNESWVNIFYEDLKPPNGEASDLVRVTVNPSNPNQIYVSSFFNGLLKIENDELVEIYNKTNSTLEPIFPNDPPTDNIRIEQSAFDRQGNLWMTNGIVKKGLKVLLANGSWQEYSLEGILNNYMEDRQGRLVIDRNNTKWFVTYANGVVGFNENGNVFKKITMGSDSGNLPIEDARSLAIDNRNQLWIGTRKGLRVLPSVDRFLSDDNLTTNAIIILDEDVAQELLYEQFITDIAVDGANNKWIGTADAGVFMVSPNGQETKYIFNTSNSPLPSNVINDIEINGTTGEVFIATSKGMVSFKATSTKAVDDLSNVIVYPNPVRPEFVGTVKITGLLNRATVKITDIGGNLVYETTSEGGTIEWDTTAFGKYRVASGVYMIFISSSDGLETKVKKVMIIR